MFLVILHLHLAPPLRLIDRKAHGIRDRIRIHDHVPLCITRRTSDRLNQRSLRTQKSFLIRIQYCYQRDLWNIQSLSQKIDTHKHIKNIQTHIPNNLRPFQSINIRMQIPHADTHLAHIICKILRHPLCKRRDQNLILLTDLLVHFTDQVVDLSLHRAHLYLGIQKPGRPNHLLCSQQLSLLLIRTWGCRDKHHLIYLAFKLFKVQGAVVFCRRKTEAIFYQR